jgi:hypothetical protein
MEVLIPKQTEAEQDQFLIDCFHDTGAIEELVKNNFSIVSGRKGAGKTALARYLEQKHVNYGIEFCSRFSLGDFVHQKESTNKVENILFFIFTKTIHKLLEAGLLDNEDYWKDFLLQNGLQDVIDYSSFEAWQKKANGSFSLKGLFSVGGEKDYKKFEISHSTSNLFQSLLKSVQPINTLIFLDDISEHLDFISSREDLFEDISAIRDLLLKLSAFNSEIADAGKKLRFVSCVRDDLFEFMQGSNINKLQNNSLLLSWDEKGFAGLLIRRLPFYEGYIQDALIDPVASLKVQFPDAIFQGVLKNLNTKRYHSNFYAYMVSVSFNRPRDFLKFCYAMRERLSPKHAATWENIESAEIEYSDYFISELRDELYLASKVFDFESGEEATHKLIDLLCRSEEFGFGHLKTTIASYLQAKSTTGDKKIMQFIHELWWYGVIGFKENDKQELINYRYIKGSARLIAERAKDFVFYLHRGIYWFVKKRKKTE